MQTRTKILVGGGAAIIAGILCYKYCPCFKKETTVYPQEGPTFPSLSFSDMGKPVDISVVKLRMPEYTHII